MRLLLETAQILFEVLWADSDGVGDAAVGQGAALAEPVDRHPRHAEPLGHLGDRQQPPTLDEAHPGGTLDP